MWQCEGCLKLLLLLLWPRARHFVGFLAAGLALSPQSPHLGCVGAGRGDNAMLWANLMLLSQRSMISRSGALSPNHIYLLLTQAVGRGTELHRI